MTRAAEFTEVATELAVPLTLELSTKRPPILAFELSPITRAAELVGDRNPREHEFSVQLRAYDASKVGQEVDGLKIGYDDRGSGEPALLCLTGWCSSKARFDHLVPLLAEKRRTLAFDWRGHGESQRDVGDFGQAEMVDDALAVIEAITRALA